MLGQGVHSRCNKAAGSAIICNRLTAWISKLIGSYAMYLAMGMNIVALLVFAAFDNMPGLLVALLIMGISAAYGKQVQ